MTLTQVRRQARELVRAELQRGGVLPGTVNGDFALDALGWIVALNNVAPEISRWHDNISENQRILFVREWTGRSLQ
jgi:hypothetical protein